jgi:hypothetical protein
VLAERREIDQYDAQSCGGGKNDARDGRLKQQPIAIEALRSEPEEVSYVKEEEAAEKRQEEKVVGHSKPSISPVT